MRINKILWLLLLPLMAMTSCVEDDVYDAGSAETHISIDKVTLNSVEVTVEWKQGEILSPRYIRVYEVGTDSYVDSEWLKGNEVFGHLNKWSVVFSHLEPGKDYYVSIEYNLPEGLDSGMYPEKRVPFKTPSVDNYVDENLKGTLTVDMLNKKEMVLVVYLPEYMYTNADYKPHVILTDKADGKQYDYVDECYLGRNILIASLPVDWQSTFDVEVKGSFYYSESPNFGNYWPDIYLQNNEGYLLEDISLPLTDSVVSTMEENYGGSEKYYVIDSFKQLTEDCSLVVMKSPDDTELPSRTVGVAVSENADGSDPVIDYSFDLNSPVNNITRCKTVCVTMKGLKPGTQYYIRVKDKYEVKKKFVNPFTPQYEYGWGYSVDEDYTIPYTLDPDVKGELPVMDMVLSDYWDGSATLSFSTDYTIVRMSGISQIIMRSEDGLETFEDYHVSGDINEEKFYFYSLSPSTKYYVSFDGLWKYEDAEHGEVLFYNLPWTTNPAYFEIPASRY